MIIARSESAQLPRLLAGVGVATTVAAWAYYMNGGLVLSHYDAKAHLVVARRVFDSITPGWRQVGAVWLPLPHLINLLPIQIDFLYRTGVFASMVSIACIGVTIWAAAKLNLAITGSALAAVTSAALLLLNPNLLYLHVTPMTEPLLLAIVFLSTLWMFEWTLEDSDMVPRKLGCALFAAAWTRYEAWPIMAGGLIAASYARWRAGVPPQKVMLQAVRLAAWPGIAVLLFALNSRLTVGSWFVTDGFYVPDPYYQGRAMRTLLGMWWGVRELSGSVLPWVSVPTAVALAVVAMLGTRSASMLVPLSLFAGAALPFYAFYQGHPFRVRYMIPTVAVCALFAGLAVGKIEQLTRRTRRLGLLPTAVAAFLIVAGIVKSSPLSQRTPILEEATADAPASLGRQVVTTCLRQQYHGEKVLVSMGALAHYMQELSLAGFDLSEFVHEGNGSTWLTALDAGPAPRIGWMLTEEQSRGGDLLAQRVRADPTFTRGMTRICEGGGVALYRRD